MEDLEESPSAKTSKRPITEEGTPDDAGETAHLPMALTGGKKFKEGDEIVLKVVAVDDDGLEVAYAKDEHEEHGDAGDHEMHAHSDMDEMDEKY